MSAKIIESKITYEELQAQNALLSAELRRIQEQLNYYINARFARKTEQIQDTKQITLFDFINETETTADFTIPEETIPEATEEIRYTRKKTKGKRDRDLKGIPTEQIIIEPENEQCPKCNDEMTVIGQDILRRELEYTPAQYKVIEYIAPKYVCINKDCEKTVVQGKLSDAQKPLINKSIATPSLIAGVVNQKYSLSIPLARQEQELLRNGVTISRQTLANWVMYSAEFLNIIIKTLQSELVNRPIIHADETTIQVVIQDKKALVTQDKNGYVWVYRTGGNNEKPIVLYDFGDGRKHINPINFLKGFKGICQCDGYQAYKNLIAQGVIIAGCWAHMRRKFTDTLKSNGYDLTKLNLIPKDEPALIGLKFCNALYKIESEIRDKSADERLKIRLKKSKLIVDYFYKFSKTLRPDSKAKLEKAYTYALNQEEFLRTFLTNGMVDIDNNRAERAVKPFVIGRKNWLFSQSEEGASASALYYSLIETAKENKLKPFEYIKWLLEEYRLGYFHKDCTTKEIQQFLPWSNTLPDHVKL